MKYTLDEQIRKVTYVPEERLKLLRALTVGEQSTVFIELSPYVQQALLKQLKIGEIVNLLDHLDLQAAKRVLTGMKDTGRRNKIISRLKNEIKDKVEYFLRFHPKATLSLIHFNYLLVGADLTIGEAGDAIEEHYVETGKFPEVLVHENGTLLGEVPIATLVRERNSQALGKFIRPVQTITYLAEVRNIVELLTSSGKKKVVVLDSDDSVLGIVYADDALELFGHMPTESLYSFTGVDSSERPFDSIYKKFNSRYKWLILNLATAFLAGSVILSFQDTLNTLTILSVYIPIVAGMGGNAASQTFAVMMRGITLGTISLQTGWPVIYREAMAGIINGMVIGAIVALISIIFDGDYLLGLVVALSMIGVHLVAGFFGAAVPLFIKYYGKDPASISMIFISTTTDVFGLIALLSLGAWILI